MSKKVFIKTFGCQMNEYDSDKMADVLGAAQGYEPTQNVDEADLILFNTCSVREKAQEKVFSDLGRIKHLKKKGVQIGVGERARECESESARESPQPTTPIQHNVIGAIATIRLLPGKGSPDAGLRSVRTCTEQMGGGLHRQAQAP